MIESGAGKQMLMYGTLEDPVTFVMRIQAEAPQGGIGVMKEDTYGNPVSGVTFGVYSDSACTKQVSTMTTISGELSLQRLEDGIYFQIEYRFYQIIGRRE